MKDKRKVNYKNKHNRVHPTQLNQRHQREERKLLIQERVHLYKNALSIPPAINQFSYSMTNSDAKDFFNFFKKYIPENKKEKKERLKSEDPKSGPKPILNKFGIKHVVDLIEQKKAKLVLIANDVDPIEVVVYLPTLCKKMGVAYAIVEGKKELGELCNLKSAACVCLCDANSKDVLEFKKLIDKAHSQFTDNYEMNMKSWGGGVLLRTSKSN